MLPARSHIVLSAALAFVALAGQAAAAPSCPSAGFTVVEAKASPSTRTIKDEGHTLFVRKDALTRAADLTGIKLAQDGDFDTQVLLAFTPAAAARLHQATTDRDGLRIAFLIDDHVLSAVTWTGPYGMDADGGVQLSLGQSAPKVRPWVEAVARCIAKPGG